MADAADLKNLAPSEVLPVALLLDLYRNEEEEINGVFNALDDNLSFPLQAEAMEEPVEVVGLDSRRSSLRTG